jgi:hypothetical protein
MLADDHFCSQWSRADWPSRLWSHTCSPEESIEQDLARQPRRKHDQIAVPGYQTMSRRCAKSAILAISGTSFAWVLLSLVGIRSAIHDMTQKWNMELYDFFFATLLIAGLALYLKFINPRSWTINILAGVVVGAVAGILSSFISAFIHFGIDGLARGLTISGTSYIILMIAVPLFPMCSWLYGALGIAAAILVEKHIMPRRTCGSEDEC